MSEANAQNLFDLSGKVALITGSGQGVGQGIAELFAAFGATVLVNDYVEDRARSVAEKIKAEGGKAEGLQGDVTDFDGVLNLVANATEKHGAVDILINNAGNAGTGMDLSDWKPFWETEPEEWNNWLAVNLHGVLNMTRAVMPGMIERKFGRIITISSDAGRVGESHLAVYSAAKAGAAGLMRAMAKGGGRFGVTANTIALGGVATPGAKGMLPDDEAIKRMLKYYIIRRVGRPSDAASMCLLLSSEAGSWITGQTYPVNGGYSFAF